MANLKELKTQIENVNAFGIENLKQKGITLSETATTYDIMKAILLIQGSGDTSIENTAKLLSSDNYVLTDFSGLYLIPKESD